MSRVCSISARLGYAAPEKVSSYIVSIIHSSKKIPRGLLVVDLFFFVIGRYAYLVFSVGCASSIKAWTKKEKERKKYGVNTSSVQVSSCVWSLLGLLSSTFFSLFFRTFFVLVTNLSTCETESHVSEKGLFCPHTLLDIICKSFYALGKN